MILIDPLTVLPFSLFLLVFILSRAQKSTEILFSEQV